jgi:hypothetical protein
LKIEDLCSFALNTVITALQKYVIITVNLLANQIEFSLPGQNMGQVRLVVNSSQPDIPQTGTSGTHTHRQHTATYQINNLTTQTSSEVVPALSTKDGPLKMVKHL